MNTAHATPTGNRPFQPLPRQLCPGCELTKAVNAFRRPKCDDDPVQLCRSCERHGPEQSRLSALRRGVGRLDDRTGDRKTCAECQQPKPLTEFRLGPRRSPDERGLVCIPCLAAGGPPPAPRIEHDDPDQFFALHSAEREVRVSLGIAIAHSTCPVGHQRTREEIAAYANVSAEAIRKIEERALSKVRARLIALVLKSEHALKEVGL